MVHIRQGRYDVALPMMIEALKAEEQLKTIPVLPNRLTTSGLYIFTNKILIKPPNTSKNRLLFKKKPEIPLP